MCRYGETYYKLHYVCVPCRRTSKHLRYGAGPRCPLCRAPMLLAGHDFAAPRRRDDTAWAAVAAVLAVGLRYEGFEPCGCGRDPKYRPRTGTAVRIRRRIAARTDVDEAIVLASREPYDIT